MKSRPTQAGLHPQSWRRWRSSSCCAMSSRRVKVSPLATVAMTRAEPAGLEPLIVALVNAATLDDARGVAARSLSNLACDDAFRRDIARAGGIEPLVALVKDGAFEQQQMAIVALKMLSFRDHANKVLIRIAGGIAPLVDLVQDYTFAAATLSNLAVDAENRLECPGEALRSSSRRYAVGAWRADGGCSQQLGADDSNRRRSLPQAHREPHLARDGGPEEQLHTTNALRVLVVNNDENLVAVSKAAALAGLAVDGFAAPD